MYRILFYSLLFALILQVAVAHENQLSGLVYMEPQTPIPEEPFKVTLELVDPEGAYISDAIVHFSIPNLNFEQQFKESKHVGIYSIELTLPDGKWLTDITEATFEDESNTIQLGINVGTKNREIIELLFPIKAKGNRLTQLMLFFGLVTIVLISIATYICRVKRSSSKSIPSVLNQQVHIHES